MIDLLKLMCIENDPNLFSLKVHHGGAFTYVLGPKRTRAPRRAYKCGNADWFDDVDADGFSMIEVSDKGLESLRADIDVLDMLSYVHKFKLIEVFIEHHVDTSVIDIDDEEYSTQESDGLGSGNAGLGRHESEGIGNDNVDDVNVGLGNDNVDENDNVYEFDPVFSYQDTNHDNVDDVNIGSRNDNVDDVNVGSGNDNVDKEGSDNSEDHDDSKDSKDSDFECDLKDRINDVHVHMEMFREHTDPNVEWVGPTKSMPELELELLKALDGTERRKALEKLAKCHKPVDGKLYSEYFYVSETFANKELIKDTVTRISVEQMRQLYLTRNDNERLRAKCEGVVPVF
ncbi:hypothetical protein Tco_1094220 [Tanacetum coccineum]|uniref:Uncharacterized protein n=1 Tax=Tanacetum coccineum TaxID=301880 RepID=A0ABQ5IEX6_9ASTR